MTTRMSSWVAPSVVTGALVLVAPSLGHAQTTPTSNDFTLDLFQGPIFAPSRVTSMGGAQAGYGQGIGAFPVNAAAPAVRHSHSTSLVEVDVDASLSFPIVFLENNDFDNSGTPDADYQSYVYAAGGVNVQYGHFGIGLFGDMQRYTVRFLEGERATAVTIGRYHLLTGYQLFGGQFVLGAGVRGHSLAVGAAGNELNTQLGMFGVAPEAGFVLKPDWSPFRIGATYRHSVSGLLRTQKDTTVDERGVRRAGGLVVPNDVAMPWEIQTGVAFQVGPRPLNPHWIDPRDHERELQAAYAERAELRRRRGAARLESVPPGPERDGLEARLAAEQREEERRASERLARDRKRLESERHAILTNWPRDRVLVTADVLVTGPVERGVGLQSFLGQGQAPSSAPCAVVASGESVNVSPRVGLEMEPVPNWMHTRFGTYYEPNRFRYAPEPCNDRVGRQHFTFGADVKAFSTTWWGLVNEVTYKVQVFGDLAPRYQSFGAGFGTWY